MERDQEGGLRVSFGCDAAGRMGPLDSADVGWLEPAVSCGKDEGHGGQGSDGHDEAADARSEICEHGPAVLRSG